VFIFSRQKPAEARPHRRLRPIGDIFLAIVCAGLLFSALCAPEPALAAGEIILNELLYDPEGADGGREFVELISLTAEARSLAGLRLEFCNGSVPGEWDLLWEGQPGDSVAAGALFLLGEEAVVGADRIVALGMQNGPEALRLARAGETLDLLGYGDGLPADLYEAWPAEDVSGRSLARRPDGVDTDQNRLDWFAAEPSPGRINFPAFRIRLLGADAPFPPAPPGEDLMLRVRAENTGLADWPQPLALSLDAVAAGFPSAEGSLPAAAPGVVVEGNMVLSAPPAGPFAATLAVGLPGEAPADSLGVELRIGVGPLIVSELLFAPASGETEWVECLAREATGGLEPFVLADLSGTEGVFTPPPLAPGERILLCPDRVALLAQHPGLPATHVLALSPWPSLANSGESPDAPGWTDGLRLDDVRGRRSDGLLYRGDWIPARGVSLERLRLYPLPGLAPWCPPPAGSTPLAGPALEPEPLAGALLSLAPNPFDPGRERLSISLRARGSTLRLRLFDAAGHLVQSLSAPLGSGQARLLWDGRDREGLALADGAYPFVLDWESEEGTGQSLKGVCGLRRAR